MNHRIEIVQKFIALTLFACTLSPFVEILFHSDNSIFASGRDTESTLAVVLLLLELSFAIARLLVKLLPTNFEKLGAVYSRLDPKFRAGFANVIPTVSPPVPLRI
jgi:hypothetical protein